MSERGEDPVGRFFGLISPQQRLDAHYREHLTSLKLLLRRAMVGLDEALQLKGDPYREAIQAALWGGRDGDPKRCREERDLLLDTPNTVAKLVNLRLHHEGSSPSG